MSNLYYDVSDMELFDEISPFLSLKGVPSRQTDESQVASEESCDSALNTVPAPTYNNCGEEPPRSDSHLESVMVCDNSYNVLMDIPLFNTAKKIENTDESQCKNTPLEDFKCHVSNNNYNNEEISLSNEKQRDSDVIEQADSEPIERMKCADVCCETHILGLCLKSGNFNGNKSSPKNVISEGISETKNYKRKQSVQNTPQDEEKHCSYNCWDGKTGIQRKNYEEKIINAAQLIEQPVETKEKLICCTTDVDAKMLDEIQCCQILEANTLIDQQHFSNCVSSEIQDNFECPSDNKSTHMHPDITLSKSQVKNKSTESLQTLPSPGKTSVSENRSIYGSSDDNEFKTTVSVPACAKSNIVNLINKPMVYSGEIAKLPCVAINKALSNFRLKLSNQPKQVYIPSRFLHQYCKSKSVRNISLESNVPILTPISPVMQLYPNILPLNTTSTSSSPQRKTINHSPTSLGVKKEKGKTVVLKSILPSTMKMVAKYVSVSGSSPLASSGTYSTADLCNQKVQLLDSSLPKITPLILPSAKDVVGNTEAAHLVTATQSSCSELAPVEIPVAERNVTSLLILPSIPKEFSDTVNVSITSQITAASAVKISAQELQNKGSANQNVFIEDPSWHLSSTDATASSLSAAENNKLNPLPDADAVWTEDAVVCNNDKEQMVKAHSNCNDINFRNVQIIRKFRLGSRTTWKKNNKCEGAIGMIKTIELVHSTRRNRRILPKCESEIKCKEKPNNYDISSSIAEIEQKNKKPTKDSWNSGRSILQKNRISKSSDSVFHERSTNKPNDLNKTIVSCLSSTHKIIDNPEPKHVHIQSKSTPSGVIESNVVQQDLSEKAQYFESTSPEYTCSPSWISDGSDKGLQEGTFTPHEVNNVGNNSHPSVFKVPSIVDDQYQNKDTLRCSPHSGLTSGLETASFSTEQGHSRKSSYSAAYDINADKGFNNFAFNNQAPLNGTFSTSTVHQMVPTAQIPNASLLNGDANMFLKDNRFDNYSTDKCNFTQENYSAVSENENNWHNRSNECKYIQQKLSRLSQSNGDKVNINPSNKQNVHCQTSNDYENEIDPNIQKSNHVTNGEVENLFFSGRNFNDMLTEPHPSTELISFLNYKKHLMEYLHGKTSAKDGEDMHQLQNEAVQKHSQNNENKMISPICKQEKTKMQRFGKCCKRRRKTKGPSKSAMKLERDKPYVCCYCGKSEQYRAILQRHLRLEHAYMPPLLTKI